MIFMIKHSTADLFLIIRERLLAATGAHGAKDTDRPGPHQDERVRARFLMRETGRQGKQTCVGTMKGEELETGGGQ